MDFSLAASYLLLFFTASFLGWCMEVICKLIQFGRFINRGFLIGPWCPIYGFGTVLITLLLSKFTDDPLAVFALAMLLCGTLEYLTSYIMEKAFHARWWDYSAKKFNLNGRVCADTLIPFGLLGLGMIYFVKPFLFRLYGQMSEMAMQAVCIALLILFLTDTVISSFTLLRLRRHAAALDGDSTEAITHAVRSALSAQPVLIRRILRAFPDASIYNRRVIAAMKERRKRLENEIKETKTRAKTALELREKNLQDTLSQYAEKLRKSKLYADSFLSYLIFGRNKVKARINADTMQTI